MKILSENFLERKTKIKIEKKNLSFIGSHDVDYKWIPQFIGRTTFFGQKMVQHWSQFCFLIDFQYLLTVLTARSYENRSCD